LCEVIKAYACFNKWLDAIYWVGCLKCRQEFCCPESFVRQGGNFMAKVLMCSVFIGMLAGASAVSANVIRYNSVRPDIPVAVAVEVSPEKNTVYLSGTLPSLKDVPPHTDSSIISATQAQTVSVLRSIEKKLNDLGLGIEDVVKMQVFLVGDPAKGGTMDYSGFMEGYKQFFGTAQQPNLPSRTVVQVAALAHPRFLVEIEVTAIRP
jgi:enamine deaminase RidA (YjgF/YER057c/UK114 family)